MAKNFRLKGTISRYVRTAISIFFACYILLSNVYTFFTRTLDDFLYYPVLFSSISYGIFLGWIAARWTIYSPPRRPIRKTAFLLLVPAPIILILCIIYYGMGVGTKDLYLWLPSHIGTSQATVGITAFVTCILGLVLFIFRLFFRCTYGLTEAIVGVVVAVQRVSGQATYANVWDSGLYLVVLTAGIYLVVRGLDNMQQGITKEPIDPIAKKIIGLIFDISPPQRKFEPMHEEKLTRRSTPRRRLRRIRYRN